MRRLLVALALVVLLAPSVQARKDFDARSEDFTCIRDWPKVRKFRLFNAKPARLRKALRIAEKGRPKKRYPVGTIIQLVPFEAMVKRRRGFNPAGGDWEFFALQPTPTGTIIRQRGKEEVVSFGLSGANCQACHSAARAYDFVCESDRGCVPINVPAEVVEGLVQRGDPRCPPQ
jgi:hypothetical protein